MKPGYKQAEVGIIPNDWVTKPLSQLSAFITKGSTPTTYGFKWEQAGILFLRSECVSEHGLDLARAMFISGAANTLLRRSEVLDGDILMTITGYVGRVVRLSGVGRANVNQHIARVRINSTNVDTGYVYHVLTQPSSRERFNTITTGQAYPQISLKQVREAEIPLPPTKAEQEAIASALSDADALIESLERLIAKKRDIKQGAMQELLTGKKRLPGFQVNAGSKQTEVGTIPEDWKVVNLGELGKLKNGINKSNEAFGHGSPFVNLMDVFGVSSISANAALGLVSTNYAEQQTYDLRKGDVIFIRSSVKPSGVGLTVVVEDDLLKTVYSGFLIRFRDGGALSDDFKRHCFYEEGFRKRVISASSVSANTNINQDNLKRLLIIMPPNIVEQAAIASVLSDMDAEIAALEVKLSKARAIKQGMMQELLTGKIRLIRRNRL